MILGDKYALFRDPFTGEPFDEPEWVTWDYILVNAVQLIEDFSMPNGLLMWENESDRVEVHAVQKVDKFEAAKEAYQKRNKREVPGAYFVPHVRLSPFAKEYPTFREWIDSQNN